MTTRCSPWPLLWVGTVLAACGTSQPITPSDRDAVVGTSTGPTLAPPRVRSVSPGDVVGVTPYVEWTEIAHGQGNGHPLAGVHVRMVTVSASNDLAKAYYCQQRPLEHGASFGVAEALLLDDEKTLYYIIERTSGDQWRYEVHLDGETSSGNPLCGDCHAHAGSDPFFRPFRDTACR